MTLADCPFCGSYEPFLNCKNHTYFVSCGHCAAHGSKFTSQRWAGGGPKANSEADYEARAQAVMEWNNPDLRHRPLHSRVKNIWRNIVYDVEQWVSNHIDNITDWGNSRND